MSDEPPVFEFDQQFLKEKEKICCICKCKGPQEVIKESSKPEYIGRPICRECNEEREYMKGNDVF